MRFLRSAKLCAGDAGGAEVEGLELGEGGEIFQGRCVGDVVAGEGEELGGLRAG